MNKEPFDQRLPQEVEIAKQIRTKNKAIVEKQKLASKEIANPKILKKLPPKKALSENGFVGIALIALFIGVVIGILSMLLISAMG